MLIKASSLLEDSLQNAGAVIAALHRGQPLDRETAKLLCAAILSQGAVLVALLESCAPDLECHLPSPADTSNE